MLRDSAGAEYRVGREANSEFGEVWNGVQVGVLHHRHHFGVRPKGISAYKVPGDPQSGIFAGISAVPPGVYGSADKRVQACCERFCATAAEANQIPFPKPAGYDPGRYELLLRIFEAGWRETFDNFDSIPNHKTDTNNHVPFSFDNIGRSDEYPEGSYQRSREILAEHRCYRQGLLYFIANDPRVPPHVRHKAQSVGLPKDEFTDNGYWPRQISVREARHLADRFVMTENELTKNVPPPTPWAWAATPSISTTCGGTSPPRASFKTRVASALRSNPTRSPTGPSCPNGSNSKTSRSRCA